MVSSRADLDRGGEVKRVGEEGCVPAIAKKTDP